MVFIHGIGAARHVDDELRSWTSALSDGARAAGHPRFADGLTDGTIETAFVHYADLFAQEQAQGSELDLDDAESELLAQLLLEVIDEHQAVGRDDDVLEQARAELVLSDQAQGTLGPLRRSINAATTLLALPGLRTAGQWLSSKLLVRDFAQVARYLSRSERDESGRALDVRIRQRLHDALDAQPDVLIAHSLGSVVAWETLHDYAGNLPLLVTAGSPLALRTVVWPRLRPQPPATPPAVARWINVWDRDDIIAARPRLENEFPPNVRGVAPASARIDSDGFWVHTATKYLRQAQLAGPVAEVVDQRTSG